jgi:cytochrome b
VSEGVMGWFGLRARVPWMLVYEEEGGKIAAVVFGESLDVVVFRFCFGGWGGVRG